MTPPFLNIELKELLFNPLNILDCGEQISTFQVHVECPLEVRQAHLKERWVNLH